MKFRTINGWTRAQMKRAIMQGNKGRRSSDMYGCSYLIADGNKCAVGVFIPDEDGQALRKAGHANASAGSLLGDLYPGLMAYMPLGIPGLVAMQSVHDSLMYAELDPRPRLCTWIDENVEDGDA